MFLRCSCLMPQLWTILLLYSLWPCFMMNSTSKLFLKVGIMLHRHRIVHYRYQRCYMKSLCKHWKSARKPMFVTPPFSESFTLLWHSESYCKTYIPAYTIQAIVCAWMNICDHQTMCLFLTAVYQSD